MTTPSQSESRAVPASSCGRLDDPPASSSEFTNWFRGMRRQGRAIDFVWLIYSIFFLIEPIQQKSAKPWIEFGIAYAIFLAIYTGLVFARNTRQQVVLFIAMAVLGFAYVPINQSACGIFIYIAAFLPFATESVWVCLLTIGGVCAGAAIEGYYFHMSPWTWGIILFMAIAVGCGNMVMAQQKRSGMKLMLAHQELAQLAKVAERERIARDLHDLLGHTLSVVVLKAELAGRYFDRDHERARQEIAEVESISRQALQQVREAVTGFRMQGLDAEVDNAQRSLAAAGIKLTCMTRPGRLGPAEESVLSLILREAITNVLRHAQATEVRLEFTSTSEGERLTVTDNGRGGIRQEGNGLRGMRERVQMLGGRFRLDSTRGTSISIDLPAQVSAQIPVQAQVHA
ncbi:MULTISPECIES: sensor histidine kinase [Acidobacterium]|nr:MULTISPECIES: sensor histidine kinase [Acidobacterium]HCT60304.1 sensor histidine kinase [Acidobacterium sp.]